MRIYLIGFMGSGKTTIGKRLAKQLDYEFVDLDAEIEKKVGCTISEYFEKYGEKKFRKLEKETLLSTFHLKNTVISTGGGTPCFSDNMEQIKRNGMSIYIKLTPKALASRLISAKKKRPLIANLDNDELVNFIEKKLKERSTYYEKAHNTVNGLSLDLNNLMELITIQQMLNTNESFNSESLN